MGEIENYLKVSEDKVKGAAALSKQRKESPKKEEVEAPVMSKATSNVIAPSVVGGGMSTRSGGYNLRH